MSNTLTLTQSQIIGNLIIELLNGEISDETLKQVHTIDTTDMDHPLQHIISFIKGTGEPGDDRDWMIETALADLSYLAQEALDKKKDKPS